MTEREHNTDTPAAIKPGDRRGKLISRYFTTEGTHPYEEVEWEMRTASITNEKGETLFEQQNVEMPRPWSQMATNVVVSKYFSGHVGTPEREHSLKQLIDRVVQTIARWGLEGGYFADEAERDVFADELTHLVLHQKLSFNSPVWFNCGLYEKPQCSACFINSVSDSMDSILGLAKTEGMLFKGGSGTGTNLSPLRGSMEKLAGGGIASGPVSFMRGFDAFAGVIKSGGKTRRAAKMVILDADHPDIVEFIECKEKEEKKAWALIDAGYDGGFNVEGGAYDSVHFQNANHSVRVTDAFMRAVIEDRQWDTIARKDGKTVVWSYPARELMDKIAEATWVCGDPGMQFDTTINGWHTCPETDRIHASNPCSEYMFLDDSACNLASLNLMKFHSRETGFDVPAFRQAVRLAITAQEIIVGSASYPTEKIGINSHEFRPLGLGYANLGALLMSKGLPYDSEQGRAYAGSVTAIMTGHGYEVSSEIASRVGPFSGYARNRAPFLKVMKKHREAVEHIEARYVPEAMLEAARTAWDEAIASGEANGYRNAQISVLAPTGTIGFMMDCDTTGVEPDIALVKYKKLVGGGMMKIVNRTVPEGLASLGYSGAQIEGILEYIDENETIEGAPGLSEEHLPVFDCAFKPAGGIRSITPMGHIRMMGAVQPFLSGAISKTVNVPNEATVEDIRDAYIESWKLGVKAVAIYRDGSKRTQPLNTSLLAEELKAEAKPIRRRLPDERRSITHKFSVGGHEGYITVGMYEDGQPGEIFITMAKQGSTISGLMDAVATGSSIALQYGVPLAALVKKFSHTRFEPAGFTGNPDVPIAKSVIDYIFRWLGHKFLKPEGEAEAAPAAVADTIDTADLSEAESVAFQAQEDSPPCPECGSMLVRNGACYKCVNCGASVGCS